MNCHEFKGGIGTSSRQIGGSGRLDRRSACSGQLRGALQSPRRRVPDGTRNRVRRGSRPRRRPAVDGSIIVISATDAPLCLTNVAASPGGRRSVWPGSAATATTGAVTCFSLSRPAIAGMFAGASTSRFRFGRLQPDAMTPLFEAAADATEEAILNALCMATTTIGVNSHTSHEVPLDQLQD